MGKFESAEKLGLRDKETNKLLAVYPYKAEGTDVEINKVIRDWYYQQSCAAEDQLLTAYVDILTEQEIKSRKNLRAITNMRDNAKIAKIKILKNGPYIVS